MKFKVKANFATYFIFFVYSIYCVKTLNPYVIGFGLIYLVFWFCTSDLNYIVEKNKIIINRIIGRKEIMYKDVVALVDPIPVLHRLNPRSGTLEIYDKNKKRFHICPEDQIALVKLIMKHNKKMNIKVRAIQKYDINDAKASITASFNN